MGLSMMKNSTQWDYVNVCTNFKPMRNPRDLILAALHNSKIELIANGVYAVAIAHNAVKSDTSIPLSRLWDPLLCPCIRTSESDFRFSNLSRHCYYGFKSHFLNTFTRCYSSSLKGAAEVSAENKSKINNFGIEIRWDEALRESKRWPTFI